MSFAARLIHRVTIVERTFDEGNRDEYGQPAATETTTDDVHVLVQPRKQREMDDSRSAGTEIGDHVMFVAPRNLAGSGYVVFRGERYDIRGVRNFAFGRSPHLEVDLMRVGPLTEVA